ncbi:MAG TPA: TIGR03435 family protein [Bryobacteraceae bacterium]
MRRPTRALKVVLFWAGLSTCLSVSAQPAAPAFEVATIKHHTPEAGFHPAACTGDRFLSTGLGLANLLSWTFDLQAGARAEFLQRVPSSMRQTIYDIQAKAASPIVSESQCRLLAQALFADRFKLAYHWDTKDAELFDLVLARGGPKMQKALPTDPGSDINIVIDGMLAYTWAPIADPAERARTKGMTMPELAQRLPTAAPAPVADKTGLEGRYKIDLRYSTSLAAETQEDPPLDAALAQLGLRLEKHRGSVKVPVLDHIEEPGAN